MSYKPKKRNKHLWEKMLKRIFFRYFLPAIIIFILSIFIFNSDFLKVKEISFSNVKNNDTVFLRSVVKESLEGKYIGLYNKNNFIFYPESKTENVLKKADKRIKSVDISYSNFKGDLEIKLENKKAEFIFCTNEKKKKCYFMEADGKIFTEFSQKETKILKKDFLKFSEKLKNKKIPLKFLAESEFKKIVSLVKEIEKIGLEIKRVEKREFGKMIFYTKNNSKIVFQIKQDFLKIPKTLNKLSAKKDLKISKVKQDFEKKMEYVDLSFAETVLYCQTGDECKNNY